VVDGFLYVGLDLADDVVAAVLVVFVADFGGDGEAGGNGHSQQVHLGQVGTFAAEQVAHRRIAFGLTVAEGVDGFAHGVYLSFS